MVSLFSLSGLHSLSAGHCPEHFSTSSHVVLAGTFSKGGLCLTSVKASITTGQPPPVKLNAVSTGEALERKSMVFDSDSLRNKAGKMAQRSRALAILAKDLDLNPSPHMAISP